MEVSALRKVFMEAAKDLDLSSEGILRVFQLMDRVDPAVSEAEFLDYVEQPPLDCDLTLSEEELNVSDCTGSERQLFYRAS